MRPGRAAKRIGLAIVDAGRIGPIRGEIAARHGNGGWIGIAETRADRGEEVATRLGADVSARTAERNAPRSPAEDRRR